MPDKFRYSFINNTTDWSVNLLLDKFDPLVKRLKSGPDLILDIRWYYKRAIDRPLSWIEAIGSAMNSYAWRKRWRNREEGTGYGKRPR